MFIWAFQFGAVKNQAFLDDFVQHFETFFFFLGPYLGHMSVPRLGVELELWLPAYATATIMPDL